MTHCQLTHYNVKHYQLTQCYVIQLTYNQFVTVFTIRVLKSQKKPFNFTNFEPYKLHLNQEKKQDQSAYKFDIHDCCWCKHNVNHSVTSCTIIAKQYMYRRILFIRCKKIYMYMQLIPFFSLDICPTNGTFSFFLQIKKQ